MPNSAHRAALLALVPTCMSYGWQAKCERCRAEARNAKADISSGGYAPPDPLHAHSLLDENGVVLAYYVTAQ
jgi:hypothetical protein